MCPLFCDQPISTLPFVSIEASTALRTRLISICSNCTSSPWITNSGPPFTLMGNRVSRLATRRTRAAMLNGSKRGCGRRANLEYDSTKRANESARDEITSRPRCMSSLRSVGRGSRVSRSARLVATDLIGASELFNSCPSTRSNRCQARRSSSRRVRLRSVSTSNWCCAPPSRKGTPHAAHGSHSGDASVLDQSGLRSRSADSEG